MGAVGLPNRWPRLAAASMFGVEIETDLFLAMPWLLVTISYANLMALVVPTTRAMLFYIDNITALLRAAKAATCMLSI